ncbi:hypothetical protein [Flavobacterium orientale]|uniref:Lipoprotein n=1 Tax=Flavobacterium orientale TaxID=1756020 RepID=A0A917DA44_9FLAO|nr:hypothetical protein [Flavobacterium orientale]GGD15957.1 hypothetical protein GCM10011343_03650 [Flavobacterium orientale]
MVKKIVIFIGLIFIVSSMTSCVEAVKESQKIIKESQKPELIGKFFPIESQGIKLFLPKEFKSLSKTDYLKLIEKSEDSTVISFENKRLRNLYLSGHDIYLFQHLESGSILSLIPTKYFKFNKADAQMLLNQIKSNHDEISHATGLSFKKQEARFFETREAQIFKAIYVLKMPEIEQEYFKQVYFVSFNKKSFALSLETGFPVDFDPFLEKIRIL